MKHRNRLKLARKGMTKEEIKSHVSPFQSRKWELRRMAMAKKVNQHIVKVKDWKEIQRRRRETAKGVK